MGYMLNKLTIYHSRWKGHLYLNGRIASARPDTESPGRLPYPKAPMMNIIRTLPAAFVLLLAKAASSSALEWSRDSNNH